MQPFTNRARRTTRGVLFVTAFLLSQHFSAATAEAACPAPGGSNKIVVENCLAGNPQSEWDITGTGDPAIQGYATDISFIPGQTVQFKIKTTATAYHIDIYRLGWYNGDGARKVATILNAATTKSNQVACLDDEAAPTTTHIRDCGTWSVSASWTIPAGSTSGIYIARPVREDDAVPHGASHIVFIVRDDNGSSDVLFQTSDTTWQAYNRYGGTSLYFPAAHAYKVSYNRPFTTAANNPESWLFGPDYPMVRFLEKNGFDVSYFSGMDTDRSGSELLEHKVFMTVGHDEYWSGQQRANVEAAGNSGIHLAFFTGNDMFWKTRWENNYTPTGFNGPTPYRTLVCYKETEAGAKIDPLTGVWTGTWRDPRFSPPFSPPADGGRPENAVSGTLYQVNRDGTSSMDVPAGDGALRFWRNTGASAGITLPTGVLGYEWNEDPDNGLRPAGQIRLSTTVRSGMAYLRDYGNTYTSGTATHHMTLHRLPAPSNALVFSAGSVQFTWGLDNDHNPGVGTAAQIPLPDVRMQQATVNLLADMGVMPQTIQAGLAPASASADVTPPISTITFPAAGATLPSGTQITITGTALDAGGGVVGGVEVSTDGGTTWHPAIGRENWSYKWTPTGAGTTATIRSRASDDSLRLETPSGGLTVNIGAAATISCPCSLFSPSETVGPDSNDGSAVNLGVKFRSDINGFINTIRFYKHPGNTGTHTGYLWTAPASGTGTKLATVTFTGESSSGWQDGVLSAPVAVTAGATYIASYYTTTGHYAASVSYFDGVGVDKPPLHALAENVQGSNGVFAYGVAGQYPTGTFGYSNYWVDVVFNTTATDTVPPTVTATSPLAGETGVGVNDNTTATFSEAMNASTINSSTFVLKDPSNSVVPASVTYSSSTMTATLDPTAALAFNQTYTATVKGGTSGAKDLAGNPLAADVTWTFTTAATYGCPCSLWEGATGNGIGGTDSNDPNATNLGMRFRSDVNGFIKAMRFYKQPLNTGTTTASLYLATSATTGTLLGSVTFPSGSSSGWQEVSFPSAIPINANTTYVAAYHASAGHFGATRPNYFASAYVNGPLRALANGFDGPNGSYHYEASPAFPSDDPSDAPNYWADIVFDTVSSGNNPPVANNDGPYTVAQGGTLNIAAPGLLANDTDVDSPTLTAIKVSNPAHGTATVNADGSFTYVHDGSGTSSSDSFTYKANDGSADSNVATVTITITLSNNAPVAANDSYTIAEGGTLNVTAPGVLGNDTDVDVGTTLTAIKVSNPAHGTLTFNANGSFTYVHDGSETTSDSFTYKANDGAADSNVATVNVTVTPVNDPPVATNDGYTATEDTLLTVNAPGVLSNDTDAENSALTAVLVAGPSHGTLTLNANGSFTYTPTANYFGTDTFTYKANDGAADSNMATVTITINNVNDAPVAVNDAYTTNEDTALNVAAPGVLSNDTDVDGNALTAARVSGPSHGTLTLNANGSFAYTPAANYNGSDSFTYRANDGTVNSGNATVTITITAVNDPPVAVNDAYSVNEDNTLTKSASAGVLANDTDVENSPLTAVLIAGPSHGTLTFNANGSFTYVPAANYNGSDSFTYKANDGTVDSNVATVTITINPVNDAPVAANDAYSTNEDTALTVPAPGVLSNDTDVDGNTLTAVLGSGPTHGTLTLNANGSFTYTPAANYNGSDSFTYHADDGPANSNTVTVTITINPVNDPPTVVNDNPSTYENLSVKIVVLANDSDVDGDTLTVSSVTQGAHGFVAINADNSLQYTPNLDYNGTDTFTYTASDGHGGTSTATVNMTVKPVNSAPTANADSYSTNEDTTLNVTAPGVLANDTDPENDPLTAALTANVSHGSLTFNTDGSFTYTPTANYNGTDTFKYRAKDSGLVTSTDDITADFLAGNIDGCKAVTLGNGDVMLTPSGIGMVEPFSAALSGSWSTNGTVTVSGGLLVVNNSTARFDQQYAPATGQPKSLEFVATFVAAPNQQIGLGMGSTTQIFRTATQNWAMFSTGSTGAQLFARTNNGTQTDTGVGAQYLGAPHKYRIEWSTTDVKYYIDGALVMTHNVAMTQNMRIGANDDTADASSLSVDWMRIGPYTTPCTFTSRVHFGDGATWQQLNATVNLPTLTSINWETRTGNVETPDASWSPFTAVSGTTITSPPAKYLQYRATLATTDGNSPTIEKVDVSAVLPISEATVTITVNPTDDAPVAANDSYTTAEDTPLNVVAPGVLANDTDIDSSSLTAVLVTNAAHGSVILNANGSFTYTPAANYNGGDSFTYKANDGSLDSNTATVTINVTAVDDAPVATNDAYSTDEDTAVTVAAPGVLTNDSDAEGDALSAVLVTDPAHGSLTLNANGAFTYTPHADYNGSDTFTYKATAGGLQSDTATVVITINPINDAPTAVADAVTTDEDVPATGNVLTNDTDPDSATPALTAIKVSDPAHGTVTLNSNGQFTYTPAGDYNGSDSFTYKANDGSADSNTATVTITINAVNDAPVARSDAYTTDEDTVLTVAANGVLANDSDVDSATITAVLASGPDHGNLTLNSDGSFTYTPAPNFNGTDSFTYKASDGSLQSSAVTVTITVTPVNDAPVATNDSYAANQDEALTVAAPGVLGNDDDVDGNALTAILVSDVAHGTLSLSSNGGFSYTPATAYVGPDTFTYKANDGLLDSNVVTVTINTSMILKDITAAQFSLGTIGTCAVVTNTGDGEVTLNPAFGDSFSGTALAAGWSQTPWAGGGAATVNGGMLTVDGARAYTNTSYSAGRSIEFVATFGASPDQWAGFGQNLATTEPALLFGTAATTNTLYARTSVAGTNTDTPIAGSFIGEPHTYRIDWNAKSVTFSIDGTVVLTNSTIISATMRPIFSDLTAGGPQLIVDWMRMSPYATPCTFTSRLFDTGTSTSWTNLSATMRLPDKTTFLIETRSGNSTTPGDTSWSTWVALNGAAIGSPSNRYIQYRVTLSTFDPNATPDVQQIVINETDPNVSISDAMVTEGDFGAQNAAFTVTLSKSSTETVTVNYATASGNATSGSDFTPASGTLTFGPGITTQTLTVAVLGDLLNEDYEKYFVNLTSATNAIIADPQGVGTIFDNDPLPSISVNDPSVQEGNSGTVYLTFQLTLSSASGRAVTVNYATANGTALAGEDFYARSGMLTFPAGTTSMNLSIQVRPDTKFEPDETLFLNLSAPLNATISKAQGTGTIQNDDAQPTISINNVTAYEGNVGPRNFVFTVTLSNPSYQDISVNYATADGTATAVIDYLGGSGTLTIPAGSTSKTITVIVIGDIEVEPTETFTVNLSSPVNATIATAVGTGTILNDD